jgi:pyruvate dehydrogenase E2 component (dihydrolipoamide acetyltransferase)
MATLIVMPRLSPTMEEGVLAKWTKKEGDKIAPGDIIAEVETDKANMDFPLEDEGVLLRQLVKAGDTVKLGGPVGILGDAGEDVSALLAEVGGGAAAPAAPAAPPAVVSAPAVAAPVVAQVVAPVVAAVAALGAAPVAAAVAAVAAAAAPTGRVLASPLARRLADEAGLDIRRVAGTGPGGRIVKRDIERAAAQGTAQAAAPAPVAAPAPAAAPAVAAPVATSTPTALQAGDELVALPMIRRTAARRLLEAKQTVPHFYLTSDAGVDALWQFREQLNASGQAAGGEKVSVNDMVLKALARALRVVPSANMSLATDGQHVIKHARVDVSVAVALNEGEGLITPVVRNADHKSLGTLAREVRELAARGREKKLRPEEYTGGTFSLTNLGMYGIREFFAIINPPEPGILAVGRVEKRPMVVEKDGKDEIRIERRMTLTLSCDHRVIDGALGARLLAEVVRGLENPMLLVL